MPLRIWASNHRQDPNLIAIGGPFESLRPPSTLEAQAGKPEPVRTMEPFPVPTGSWVLSGEGMQDFEQFFGREYDRVLRSLVMAFGDEHRAEEAAQEGFARAFRRWGSIGALNRPGTWVYVVALRAERQRWGRDARIPGTMLSHTPDPAGAVVEDCWLLGGLARLSPRQRLATVLRYYADLTIEEVADAMGCAPGTVKATIHAALAHLRVDLRDQDQEVPRAF